MILFLFLAVVPDTVQNLNGKVLSPQAVNMSWLPPRGGATYLDYRVTMNPLYNNGRPRVTTTSSTGVVITGLQPGTFYLCVVAARTSAGLQHSVNVILVEMPADGKKHYDQFIEGLFNVCAFFQLPLVFLGVYLT